MKASKLISKNQRKKEYGNYIMLKKVIPKNTDFETFLTKTIKINVK
tara:strand:- start:321 stop:458 length:138 start_codon:yes stop_codon:yes gene_type:complete